MRCAGGNANALMRERSMSNKTEVTLAERCYNAAMATAWDAREETWSNIEWVAVSTNSTFAIARAWNAQAWFAVKAADAAYDAAVDAADETYAVAIEQRREKVFKLLPEGLLGDREYEGIARNKGHE